MSRNPYEPYEILRAPARKSPELWRLVVGAVLCLAIYMLGLMAYFPLASFVLGLPAEVLYAPGLTNLLPSVALALLFSFSMLALAPFIVVRTLHARSGLSLIGNVAQGVRLFLRVVVMLLLVTVVIQLLPPYSVEEAIIRNQAMPFATWFLLLPVSLLGVLIQVSAEELVFRGYIQSQASARLQSPYLWIGLPALVFGLMHYDTTVYGDGAILIVIWATLFGIVAGDLTARSGSLGPAIAVHFMNNVFAILYVGNADMLGGLALYHYKESAASLVLSPSGLAIELCFLLIAWLAARIAIRR